MTEKFSFEVNEGNVKEIENAIHNEIKAIHKRFENGTETEDDLLYQYPHFKMKVRFIDQTETELDVVENKYYEKMRSLVVSKDTEINKLNKELDITKTNYEILQGEMDRIGIDTLHLEAGSSTDDVIDEINKLKNVIDKIKWKPITEYDRQKYDWVLVKYFDGDYECIPEVAEQRSDGKWYTSEKQIPFEVKYFFDMQILKEDK